MENVWNDAKEALRQRIPTHSYRMWIEPIVFSDAKNGRFVLFCPNQFSKKRVMEQYGHAIASEINLAANASCEVVFAVTPKKNGSHKSDFVDKQMPLPHIHTSSFSGRHLRNDFTFDQFVVGDSNDFAYSAALSLAAKKISRQQSLLLFSKTGMGKSHLSQAVGHYIIEKFPKEHVYYITAEDFTNEVVQSFRSNSVEQFKKKYRNGCDVLLLEDIHYLSGKERTQMELAMTLEFLFSMDKKVIFSSSLPPHEIPKLDDKLRSHFSSGIVSHIESPCYRTRVRILQKKAQVNGFHHLQGDIIEYLASELTEDIRQLESGLIGVATKSSLMGIPINLKLAESVIKNIVKTRKSITIDVIKKLVCKHYGITLADIVSRSRKQCFTRPRQMAIYLSRKYTDSPLQTIGRQFNRYHATALHAINSVERGVKNNTDVKKQVLLLSEKLEAGKF
ncbi:MAG: chromosomal replication initiator protein DnaA [Desulfobacterales bacterium]